MKTTTDKIVIRSGCELIACADIDIQKGGNDIVLASKINKNKDGTIVCEGDRLEFACYWMIGETVFANLIFDDIKGAIRIPVETFECLLRLGALKVAS